MDGLFLVSLRAQEEMGQHASLKQAKCFGNSDFSESLTSKAIGMLEKALGSGTMGILAPVKEMRAKS